MKPKSIVAKEVARQAEFGMEPGWEDFAVAGIREVVDLWLAKLKEWGIE